jgi:hypothetical protein
MNLLLNFFFEFFSVLFMIFPELSCAGKIRLLKHKYQL